MNAHSLIQKKGLIRNSYIYAKKISGRGVYKHYHDEARAIFVHIPKAAGKSVGMAVFGDDKPGHYYATDYRFADKRKFSEYFTFSFVRNPVDRFLSAYYFLKSGRGTRQDTSFFNRELSRFTSIDSVVGEWLDERSVYFWPHFVPQVDYLTDSNGSVIVDFVGKVESFERDFNIIATSLGCIRSVGKVNSGVYERPAISKDLKKKIMSIYAFDYDAFYNR